VKNLAALRAEEAAKRDKALKDIQEAIGAEPRVGKTKASTSLAEPDNSDGPAYVRTFYAAQIPEYESTIDLLEHYLKAPDNAALAELVGGLDNRWAAATIGSMGASSLELKSGASIMAIGGFTGGDNSPTLTQFQHYVANHEIRYFIEGEHFGPPGHRESGAASEITDWVKQNFTAGDVGGSTVYDLTAPK